MISDDDKKDAEVCMTKFLQDHPRVAGVAFVMIAKDRSAINDWTATTGTVRSDNNGTLGNPFALAQAMGLAWQQQTQSVLSVLGEIDEYAAAQAANLKTAIGKQDEQSTVK